jgi:hypothetical protein
VVGAQLYQQARGGYSLENGSSAETVGSAKNWQFAMYR